MASRFLGAVADYGKGRISLLDLSRRARQVADTLGNASAPLPELLKSAESDLEYTFFATESAEHPDRAGRIVQTDSA